MNSKLINGSLVLFAGGDMRFALIAVAVVLALGIATLQSIGSQSERTKPRRALAGAAFATGPIAALVFLLVDILWMSPQNYRIANDYAETMIPVLAIGLFSGALGAGAIWLSECASIRCQRRRPNASSSDEPNDAEPNR